MGRGALGGGRGVLTGLSARSRTETVMIPKVASIKWSVYVVATGAVIAKSTAKWKIGEGRRVGCG